MCVALLHLDLTAAVIMLPFSVRQSPGKPHIHSVVCLSSPPVPSLSLTSTFHIISQLPSADSYPQPATPQNPLFDSSKSQPERDTLTQRQKGHTQGEFVLTGVAQQWALNLPAERLERDTEMEKGERYRS